MQVDIVTSALPTGAATEVTVATLATEATLSSLDAKNSTHNLDSGAGTENNVGVSLRLSASGGSVEAGTSLNPLRVDPTGTTAQPVSATALPLPTGASTSALQSTGNTSLGTIAGAVSGTEMQVDVITMPSVTVTATDLDIRDLTSVSDSISAVQSGTWNVTNISGTVSLPTGAATSANQSTGNASLSTIAGDTTSLDSKIPANLTVTSTRLLTDSSGVTQPVSAASLPLPTGAATSANQTTGNSSLTTLAGAISGTEMQVDVLTSALPSGASTAANQSTANSSLSNMETDLEDKLAGSLVPSAHDYIAMTYVAAGNGAGEIETSTYKIGGAGGSTVATLTLTYDSSDRIATITKS